MTKEEKLRILEKKETEAFTLLESEKPGTEMLSLILRSIGDLDFARVRLTKIRTAGQTPEPESAPGPESAPTPEPDTAPAEPALTIEQVRTELTPDFVRGWTTASAGEALPMRRKEQRPTPWAS